MNLTVAYDPAKDAENHVRAIFDDANNTYGRDGMKEKLLATVADLQKSPFWVAS